MLTQEWFRELSFSRLECGVHISSADWWDIFCIRVLRLMYIQSFLPGYIFVLGGRAMNPTFLFFGWYIHVHITRMTR